MLPKSMFLTVHRKVEPKHRVVDKLSCGDRLKFGFALADELE
jgi:hypothetical protein